MQKIQSHTNETFAKIASAESDEEAINFKVLIIMIRSKHSHTQMRG